MNKKRLLLVLTLLLGLFLLSGCTVPTDENGNIQLIYSTTTFKEMLDEGFFSAILVYPLSQAINLLTPAVGVGLAIALVTLILNAIILVCTFKSNVSMQRMQAIQPEVARIEKKYEGKDDDNSKMRKAQELQSLYTKNNINPLGSLVATFIQFPVLIAMYNAIRRSDAVTNGVFMGMHLSTTPLQAIKAGTWVGLGIYIMMLLLQILSMKIPQLVSERRARAEADKHHKTYRKPETPNNFMMTYGMVIFIGIIMISWPTGLSLYYCIYSLVNIIKTIAIDQLTHREGK